MNRLAGQIIELQRQRRVAALCAAACARMLTTRSPSGEGDDELACATRTFVFM